MTSTVTLTLTSTKVVEKTSPVTIEKVKTATETVENTVTEKVEKPVTYTVVETKVDPTTTVEVVTSVVPTGQFLFSILVRHSLKVAFQQLSTKLSPLPAVQLSLP